MSVIDNNQPKLVSYEELYPESGKCFQLTCVQDCFFFTLQLTVIQMYSFIQRCDSQLVWGSNLYQVNFASRLLNLNSDAQQLFSFKLPHVKGQNLITFECNTCTVCAAITYQVELCLVAVNGRVKSASVTATQVMSTHWKSSSWIRTELDEDWAAYVA
jgi:hypothetical protein